MCSLYLYSSHILRSFGYIHDNEGEFILYDTQTLVSNGSCYNFYFNYYFITYSAAGDFLSNPYSNTNYFSAAASWWSTILSDQTYFKFSGE